MICCCLVGGGGDRQVEFIRRDRKDWETRINTSINQGQLKNKIYHQEKDAFYKAKATKDLTSR